MKSEYIKEMQELAVLKAENERLKEEAKGINNLLEALIKLQADKAELKEILYEVYNRYASLMSTKMQDKLKGVLSKHEAK